jgi:hypothetical protein
MKHIRESYRVDNFSDGRICFRIEDDRYDDAYYFSYYPIPERCEGVLYVSVGDNPCTKLIVEYKRKIRRERNTITGDYDVFVWGFEATLLDSTNGISFKLSPACNCLKKQSVSCGKIMRHLARQWAFQYYLYRSGCYDLIDNTLSEIS